MPNTLVTEGGNLHVETPRRTNESDDDWILRHSERVDDAIDGGTPPGPDLHTYWTSGEQWDTRTPPFPPPTSLDFAATHLTNVAKAWKTTPPAA